ncbi:MAG: caspase family protein, partial [Candidatus Aminicenantes bacterium]
SRALMEKGILRHILWTGCRADQLSADALIDEDWHGAFTYYFCKEMRAHQNQLTRKDLMKKVRENLKEGDYTQIPQLECEAKARNNAVAIPIT